MRSAGVQYDHTAFYRSVIQTAIFFNRKKEMKAITQENKEKVNAESSVGQYMISLQIRSFSNTDTCEPPKDLWKPT